MSILLPPLLARCEAMLKRKILDSDRPNAAEIRGEILAEFSVLFAEDGSGEESRRTRLLRVPFQLELSEFLDRFHAPREGRAEPLEELPPENETPDSSGSRRSSPPRLSAFRNSAMQLPDVFLQRAPERDPGSFRRTSAGLSFFVVSSDTKRNLDDPAETTAASLCGVTGRTIRNRLHRAAAKLSKFKEEEDKMTATNHPTPLRDVLYAFSLAQPVPDARLLDEFVRRYPEHVRR